MQIHALLMVEHSVIGRMIEVIKSLIEPMHGSRQARPLRLDNVIDFLCMYADRCHHVKEEDIFFYRCDKKGMHETDKKIMEELIEEHIFIMKTVGDIIDAWQKHADGHRSAKETLRNKLEILTTFYPEHMRKEDEIFFPKALTYFSHDDQDSMLREFSKFDENSGFEEYLTIPCQLELLAAGTPQQSTRQFHLFQPGRSWMQARRTLFKNPFRLPHFLRK